MASAIRKDEPRSGQRMFDSALIERRYSLFARVFAGHRSDVGNFPARSRKCFDHRDHHDDEKSEMDERLNDGPEENQQAAQCRDGAKNIEDDPGNNIKNHPGPAKDD